MNPSPSLLKIVRVVSGGQTGAASIRPFFPATTLFRVGPFLSTPPRYNPHMKLKFYPLFRDEGELIASWGEARLIKFLDGKLVLKGGSKEDRQIAHEWISLFWHEAVVREL
jgi:hypothetical protein